MNQPSNKAVLVSWGRDKGAAKLGGGVFARLNLAAQILHHHLLAIADAQNGQAARIDRGGWAR